MPVLSCSAMDSPLSAKKHNKYSGLCFRKINVYFFFSFPVFSYSWIKERLKTEIYEKIKEVCNTSQNSVQADKIMRPHMTKFVCKT